MLTEVWKYKNTKENMKEIKEYEIRNTLHRGLSVVPKTDDEIYISISICQYIITFTLCIVAKKAVLLKIPNVMLPLEKSPW